MDSFLQRMARRLRLVWAWSTTSLLAPIVAGLACFLVAIGWLAPWAWPERAALGVVASAVLVMMVAGLVQRLPEPAVARAADRGLGTHDGLGAAVAFQDLVGPFGERVQARAEAIAASADPAEAAPFQPHGRRWAIAALAGAVAVVLAFGPNPQDDTRADRARDAAEIEAQADRLEVEADRVIEEDAAAEAADALEAAADQLRRTDSLEQAREILQRAQDELDASRPPDFAAQRAASDGLEQSLQSRPLDATGDSAAAQLQAAAAGLDGLDPGELAALEERLGALAATQTAGNQALAEALSLAAGAIAAGDLVAATDALDAAAQLQADAADGVAAQLAAGDASAALAAAQAALGAASIPSDGQGQGAGQGQGQGQGSGQGQGQGQGQGSGQGQGAGQGQEAQGGGASGQVGGAQSGGQQGGQGGAGTPGGFDQDRIDEDAGQTIIDPSAFVDGEDTNLGGQPTGDADEIVGEGEGLTTTGLAQVPLADLISEYADRATAALDRSPLPPSQQELVGTYFDQLTTE